MYLSVSLASTAVAAGFIIVLVVSIIIIFQEIVKQTTLRYKYFILDPELFTPGRDSLGMKHDYDNNLGKRLERVPDMPFYPAGLLHFFYPEGPCPGFRSL